MCLPFSLSLACSRSHEQQQQRVVVVVEERSSHTLQNETPTLNIRSSALHIAMMMMILIVYSITYK
jgi:hypothetical protein